jgi:hypothetical protein
MKDPADRGIDHLFHDSLELHKHAPGEHVWREIEKKLDFEERASSVRTNKRVISTASLVLLCTLLVSLIWYELQKPAKKPGLSERSPIPGFVLRHLDAGKKVKQQPFNFPKSISNSLRPVLRLEINRDALVRQTIHSAAINSAGIFPIFVDSSRFQPAEVQMRPLYLANYTLKPKDISIPSSGADLAPETAIRLKKPIGKLSIAAFVSKDFAGYNFSDNDLTGANGKEIEDRERNVFSASVGLNLNYRISRKWSIQSGIAFSWSNSNIDSAVSFAVKNETGNVQFQFNSVLGYSYLSSPGSVIPSLGDSISTAKSNTSLHYLTVPLIISYRIDKGRFGIAPGAGVTFNILTKAAMETKVYGAGYELSESEIPIQGLKKINVGLLIKADLEYRFSSRWAFQIIPSFRNTLGPVNLKGAVSAYPYNFGIGTGLRFVF